ncbi:hypothetical protein BU202_03850 [Streptococcus cuniculi]|uniref:ABC transporter substrate-binding protein n=1 Tax=Streptococcus cuniculi TaxID=1432788 RepID=A0A1Q8E8K9_9STRE|nr:ABC transporter substrate-binding protein [Streptococcus cuniculi]OLF48135.1 hypothetical protein BU202_03850 [Streptococcus cuniculi]
MKKTFQMAKMGFALCASMLLVACGSSGESSKESSESTNSVTLMDEVKPVDITFWHAMKGPNADALEKIVADYNATVGKEKGVTVTPVFQDTGIASKVKMAASTDDIENAPDIIQTVGSDIPSLSALEEIVPAQEFFDSKNAGITTDDYYPHLLRTFTYKEKIMGVPMNVSTLLLYYNEDLLKKAGHTEAPATIAELAQYSTDLGKVDGVTGLNTEIARYQLANFIVSQSEKSFMGDNEGGRLQPMTEYTMGKDGTLKAFLTEWEKVVQSGSYKYLEDNPNEEFASGLNAMVLLSSARLGAINHLVGDKFQWKTAFLPKVNEKDTSGASVGGSALVMYNRGDNNKLAAAWDFIKYATSPEVQATWSQATGYIPVNKNTEKLDSMVEFYAKNPNYKVALEQMKASSPMAQEPFDLVNWEVNDIVKDTMGRFAQKQLSVDEAVEELSTKSNEALAEYIRVNE